MCFNRYILRRHSFGDFLIPTLKGIALSCRIVRGGNCCTVILRDRCNLTSAVGIKGYCVLIDFPLRPVFLIARFCAADCCNRRAGQIFVVIPALERISRIGQIVGCRQCCTHAVGVSGDIAVIDRSAVCVQRYGIGRGCPLHCQCRHISRNSVAGCVELPVAAKPLKVAAGISVRAGQTVRCRSGKAFAAFHNDLNILGAAAQLAAVQVKGNDLHPVRAQCVRVQDFKDGAETDVREGARSIAADPVAGRIVPTNRTVRRGNGMSILPPRIHFIPVLDISAVLIQHRVPFVALGHDALGSARTCSVTSHRRCAQGIVHAAAGIIFAENQICGIQGIPAYIIRYGIIRHEQAVGIFILLCILLGGCHLRCELVGIHRPCVGKGNIVQRRIRQGSRAKDVSGVHRPGNIHRRQVKIVSAAGGKGKLLVRLIFHRQRNVCEITCVIGIIIAVILLAEDLQGIAARCKVGRDFDLNRSAFGSRLCYSGVILCAVVIRQDDRDIFIYPCGRPFVIQRNGTVRGGADSFFHYGKTAAAI